MMELIDLRAISEGCDIEAVRTFGGAAMLECADVMNEVNKGAFQSIQHALMGTAKEVRDEAKAASSAIKDDDKKNAKKHLDKALELIKKGRKEAEEIEDDGFLEHIVISMIMSIVPYFGAIAYQVGFISNWLTLRNQVDKGAQYSNKHPERKKNAFLELIFGVARGAGYSRAQVLAGYDKMTKEIEKLKEKVDNMPDKKEDK